MDGKKDQKVTGKRNEKIVELVVGKNVVLDIGQKVVRNLDKSPLIQERVEMLLKKLPKIKPNQKNSVRSDTPTPKVKKIPNRKPKHDEKNQPKITSFIKTKFEVGRFTKTEKKHYTPLPPYTEELEGGRMTNKLIYEWPLPVSSPTPSRSPKPECNLKKNGRALMSKKPPKTIVNATRPIKFGIPATQTIKKTLSGTPPESHSKSRIPPESWVEKLGELEVAFPPFPTELLKHGNRKPNVLTEHAQLENEKGPRVKDRVAFFSVRKRRRLVDEFEDDYEDEKPVKKMKDDRLDGLNEEGKCEMKNNRECMKFSISHENSKKLATGMKFKWGIEHAQTEPGTPSMSKIWEPKTKQGSKGEFSSQDQKPSKRKVLLGGAEN